MSLARAIVRASTAPSPKLTRRSFGEDVSRVDVRLRDGTPGCGTYQNQIKRIKHHYRCPFTSVKLKAVVKNFYPVNWIAESHPVRALAHLWKERCVYERRNQIIRLTGGRIQRRPAAGSRSVPTAGMEAFRGARPAARDGMPGP